MIKQVNKIKKTLNTKGSYMKNNSLRITSIQEIADKYQTYFIDLVGVVYDGKNPYNNAIKTINRLLNNNKQIVFLSNNPNPSENIDKKLKTFGITGNYYLVTSGDLLHHTLMTTLADKKIYHLGRNRQHALLKSVPTKITYDLSQADAVIVSCYIEEQEDHDMFNTDLQKIAACKKPIYCPTPDKLAFDGTSLIHPSGYFAEKIEQFNCPVIYLGKPSRLLYDFIQQKHPTLAYDKATTLMIGDTLETDICGAITYGIDSLLILNGITGLYIKRNPGGLKHSSFKPSYTINTLL